MRDEDLVGIGWTERELEKAREWIALLCWTLERVRVEAGYEVEGDDPRLVSIRSLVREALLNIKEDAPKDALSQPREKC